MKTTTIQTFTLGGHLGLEGRPVTVTAEPREGRLLDVVGLPELARKEVSVRVRSALLAIGKDLAALYPTGVRVSISNPTLPKISSALDLPIALALFAATAPLDGLMVLGELGLDGSVRAVRGVTQAVLLAEALGCAGVLLPMVNAAEAMAVVGDRLPIYTMSHLGDTRCSLKELRRYWAVPARERFEREPDLCEVRGQPAAVLDAVVDAIAAHARGKSTGLVLVGPPGVGKTMIARRIAPAMSALTREQTIEASRAYSALGLLRSGIVERRPFRAPHHTISAAALVGGGARGRERPGELHLAQHGVLFLDEIEEFPRATIEALAIDLDQMPAHRRPLVVAAAKPCPCGWLGSATRACACPESAVKRHQERTSWALSKLAVTARADLRSPTLDELRGESAWPTTAEVRARVEALVGINKKP